MLAGKLALITGSGSGIGRAACQLMAREGATIVAADINEKQAAESVKLLEGGEHMSCHLDVSSESSVQSMLETVLAKYSGPPTIVVNSAGITRDSFLLKMPLEYFQQVIDVNLKGTYLVTQAICRKLVEIGNKGSIVNIASVVGQTGNLGQANYSASKAGVEAFTKTVAQEMGQHGIRCNAVVPGFIESPMTDAVPDKVRDMFRKKIPLGRLGKPEEVAEVITFLASEKSSYVNGASFSVTGGL